MADKVTTELVAQIAAYLPDWKVTATDESMYYHNRILSHPTGMKMHLSESREAGKVAIETHAWPTYTETHEGRTRTQNVSPAQVYPRETAPSIAVSIARGAEVIAREIKRRFIPEYTRVWDLCTAQAAENQLHSDMAKDSWETVCKFIGKSPSHNIHYVGNLRMQNRFGTIHFEGDLKHSEAMKLITAMNSKGLDAVLQKTDWELLRNQKRGLVGGDMDGLLHWIDAIQDAAEEAGYPVQFDTEVSE